MSDLILRVVAYAPIVIMAIIFAGIIVIGGGLVLCRCVDEIWVFLYGKPLFQIERRLDRLRYHDYED